MPYKPIHILHLVVAAALHLNVRLLLVTTRPFQSSSRAVVGPRGLSYRHLEREWHRWQAHSAARLKTYCRTLATVSYQAVQNMQILHVTGAYKSLLPAECGGSLICNERERGKTLACLANGETNHGIFY